MLNVSDISKMSDLHLYRMCIMWLYLTEDSLEKKEDEGKREMISKGCDKV